MNDGLGLSGGLYDARADNDERWSCLVGRVYDARADNDERWSCLVGRALRRESGHR